MIAQGRRDGGKALLLVLVLLPWLVVHLRCTRSTIVLIAQGRWDRRTVLLRLLGLRVLMVLLRLLGLLRLLR